MVDVQVRRAMVAQRLRVGVVGTGIAGLSAAWLMAQEHEVDVFEKASSLGFESNSVDINLDNSPLRVDVPLRLFDEKFYFNLSHFYKHIGVEYTPANYCQSYSTRHDKKTYFRYFNRLIGRFSVPFVDVSKMFTWSYLLIMRDALRLYFLTPLHFRDPAIRDLTFGEYLDKYGFSKEFADRMLLPTLSAMCTCSYDNVRAYPADMLLDLVTRRAGGGVRIASGGSKDIIAKISKPFSQIHCNTPVASVHPHPTQHGKVCVVDHTGKEHIYDHVIVATQANHALKLVSKPQGLVDALRRFQYDKGAVYVHTDQDLMPKERSGWANVSYLYDQSLEYPVANIWMNQVVPHMISGCKDDIFQTIFPAPLPEPSKTLGIAQFERPLMNKEVVKGIQQLRTFQGQNNIWFCGAHAAYGIPLQENALASAIYVASSLGVKIPWQTQEVKVTPTYPSGHVFFALPWRMFLLFIFVIFLSIFWRSIFVS